MVKLRTYTITVVIMALIAVGGVITAATLGGQMATTTPTGEVVKDPETGENEPLAGCNQKPDVDVMGIDSFSKSSEVLGTAYLKRGDEAAEIITGSTNVNARVLQQGLVINDSWFCSPAEKKLDCAETDTIKSECIENGSATVKVKDLDQDEFVGGAYNVTMTAEDDASLEVRYDGQSEKANMPYGGCVIVEVPKTITEVSLAGEGVSEGCDFQTRSYTPSSTSNTVFAFEVPMGYDADTGSPLKHNLELASEKTDPSGTAKISFLPAAYYVSEDGNYELDVEKAADGSNTRTFGSTISKTFGIV